MILRDILGSGLQLLIDHTRDLEDNAVSFFMWPPSLPAANQVRVECICNENRALMIGVGGIDPEIVCQLIVRDTNFLDASSTLVAADSEEFTADMVMPHPQPQQIIYLRGRRYRIHNVDRDACLATYVLNMVDANSGR